MLSVPSHDLGVAGWVCLAAMWLGSTLLLCQTVLTALRWLFRYLDRRHGIVSKHDVLPAAVFAPVRMVDSLCESNPLVAQGKIAKPIVGMHRCADGHWERDVVEVSA